MAQIASPAVEELLPNVSLQKALNLADDSVILHNAASVSVLCLSMRPSNCLASQQVFLLGQLITLSVADLYAVPAMGRGSIQEIVSQVCAYFEQPSAFAPFTPARPAPFNTPGIGRAYLPPRLSPLFAALPTAVFFPLTLRDEWNLFSQEAPASFALTHLALSQEAADALQTAGIQDARALLDCTLQQMKERVGEQCGDEILTAVNTLAMQQDRTHGVQAWDAASRDALTEECRRLLLKRWEDTPLTLCGFSPRTTRVLLAAQMERLTDVLNALEPLHSGLCFDLAAFRDVWNRLNALGLRQGDAQTEWERLLADRPQSPMLDNVLQDVQRISRARGWEVIRCRYALDNITPAEGDEAGAAQTALASEKDGLGNPAKEVQFDWEAQPAEKAGNDRDPEEDLEECGNAEEEIEEEPDDDQTVPRRGKTRVYRTLEEVAKALYITRERVRQIEYHACNALRETKAGAFAGLTRTLALLVEQIGGVTTKARIAQELSDYFEAGSAHAEGVCHLIMECSDAFAPIQRGAVYRLAHLSQQDYERVLKAGHSVRRTAHTNLQGDEFVAAVQETLRADGYTMDNLFVAACLQTDPRFDGELIRRDIPFLLMETLRRIGKPAHHSEIARALNASGLRANHITEKTVSCRLSECRDLFAYLAPGTYGLTAWGLEDKRVYDRYRNGNIGDLIEAFLTERDAPAPVSEIIAHVLSLKRCQEMSVAQCLSSDARFLTSRRGVYALKKWV